MSEPIRVFLTVEQWRAYVDELRNSEDAVFIEEFIEEFIDEEEEEEDVWETSDLEFIDDSDVEPIDDEAEFVGFVETSEEDTDWSDNSEDFIES
jgi:hypothetical protein